MVATCELTDEVDLILNEGQECDIDDDVSNSTCTRLNTKVKFVCLWQFAAESERANFLLLTAT